MNKENGAGLFGVMVSGEPLSDEQISCVCEAMAVMLVCEATVARTQWCGAGDVGAFIDALLADAKEIGRKSAAAAIETRKQLVRLQQQ